MSRTVGSAKERCTELRESEVRFRSLSALSADVYWEQDERLRFTSFSSAGSREFELGRTESLVGKTRWETEYINMSEADWAAHRSLLDTRHPFRDLELCRIDAAGRKSWIRVSGEPVFDAAGAFKGYRGIARNFTERRRAEELRELEHTVTRILAEADSASAGLQTVFRAVCETEGWDCGRYFRLDEQAGLLRFAGGWSVPDAAVEHFVAASRDKIFRRGEGLSGLAWQTGHPLWSVDVTKDPRSSSGWSKTVPRGIGIHGAFVFPVVLGGKTMGVFNFATRRAREPEEQLVQAITAIGGQIGQFLQRRQADEQRRILEAQLRQAQKAEAIGTLATGMAHEFNNIIRAILANVELARTDIGSQDLVRADIEEIDKAGRRARDFVQRILAFARPQAPQRRRMAPGEVVREAARLMRATLPPCIQLIVEIGADTPEILGDATQIHQLAVNLLTNACQAMEGRSGKIVVQLSGTVPGASAMHRMPGFQIGRFAHLSVADSGIGIDPSVRERIFDPFFSTKRIGEGTGLGLAVVNGIVRAHEGFIDVESRSAEGATLHVYLPAAPASDAADEAPLRPRDQGRRVLIVDDNEQLVTAFVQALSRQGYRVSGYTAPEKALDAVSAEPQGYDVVVSDYKMPRMSGLDVAREMSRIRPDLPVVIMAGYIDAELQRSTHELGVRCLLNKLDTLDELVRVIDQVC